MNSVARFLEARGHTANALEVATDPDYRFELAVQLSKLEVALEIAETADSEGKWRQLSELAMSSGKLQVHLQHSVILTVLTIIIRSIVFSTIITLLTIMKEWVGLCVCRRLRLLACKRLKLLWRLTLRAIGTS